MAPDPRPARWYTIAPPLTGSQAGPLLDQVAGPVVSVTADGAYDQDRVYASVAERHPEAAVVVPLRATRRAE